MTLEIDLTDKKGLVVGIANSNSIAYGCAVSFNRAGAGLALTYQNDKTEGTVRFLGEKLGASLILPLDVQRDDQLEAVFHAIEQQWGRLDFLLHSIAYAPKVDLHGRVIDSSKEGFAKAMDISCHSFIRMARLAEPLMSSGGSLLTVSYMGGDEVVEHYGIMGPVKAALESATRYLASELGTKKIRVNALSPGAIPTRAASGIAEFDSLLANAHKKAPLQRIISLEDIGSMAAFLVSDLSQNITGEIHLIDAGYRMMD
ncbi:MAG: enoyl-ACP reductase FabI [Rickettsiales bacterium]